MFSQGCVVKIMVKFMDLIGVTLSIFVDFGHFEKLRDSYRNRSVGRFPFKIPKDFESSGKTNGNRSIFQISVTEPRRPKIPIGNSL